MGGTNPCSINDQHLGIKIKGMTTKSLHMHSLYSEQMLVIAMMTKSTVRLLCNSTRFSNLADPI